MFTEMHVIPSMEHIRTLVNIKTGLECAIKSFVGVFKDPSMELIKVINQLNVCDKETTLDMGMQIFKFAKKEFVQPFLGELIVLQQNIKDLKEAAPEIEKLYHSCLDEISSDVQSLIDLFKRASAAQEEKTETVEG